MALFKLYCLYSKEEQIDYFTYTKVIKAKHLTAKEYSRAFKAQVTALARLFCLKKIYKKVYLKEYCLIK